MALSPGSRVGPYEILSALGSGGMGEVYRARDTKLNRDVAIKVLPESVANEPERLERFHREAQVLAALNHPNIAHVYGFEDSGSTHGLVMELVEGPTLDDRIAQGPIPLNEALPIARQIAEALEAAHEQGIIHRDLKPANIKVRDVGIVKVLDFGLAKLVGSTAAPASHPDVTASPTIASPAMPFAVHSGQTEHGRGMITREGVILGTPAYMSPEQARGRVADKRSDVWAFGAVLYEMLTGKRAFRGETTTDVLAAVVSAEPDWEKLPASAQPLLRLCLEKDPDRRLRHVGDFERLLEARPAAPHATRVPWSAVVAVLALVAAGIASWALWRAQRKPPEIDSAKTIKFTFTPAQLSKGSNTDIDTAVFISSDGKHIAYVESPTGQLWIRDLDQEQARLVPGATGVYEAFWSPDDKTIGYSTGSACMPGTSKVDCGLVKIPVQGGSSVLITKIQGGFRRASWSSDGETIVYCDTTGIYTVPARGGAPTPVVEDPPFLDPGGRPHIEHPSFLNLPDGRRAVLFQAIDAPHPGHGIYIQVMGEKRGHLITATSSSNPYPAYSPTGHVIYTDGNFDTAAIWALPFSLTTLQATEKAFPIAPHGSSPRVSHTGTLVYSDIPSNHVQLAWKGRSGNDISNIGEPIRQDGPALSPDGHRLTVVNRENDVDIWLYDMDRGTKTRLTFDSTLHSPAVWTPSGDEITYAVLRNGKFGIVSKPSHGNSETKLLVGSPLSERAPDWSPDGRFLIYMAGEQRSNTQLLYLEHHKDGSFSQPMVFVKTTFNEANPRFSPDGRYVAYVSDESGRNEVYVRDFPNGVNKWLISANGGTMPRWSRGAKEVFYIQEDRLMAVSVATHPQFSPGVPVSLFESRLLQLGYDVSPDGKRFVVLTRPRNEPAISIHIVDNWFEEFRRR